MQLSGEGLLPFSADKQTAFGLAVYNAFGDHTSLYALNVTDPAAPPAAAQRRFLSSWHPGLPYTPTDTHVYCSELHDLAPLQWGAS